MDSKAKLRKFLQNPELTSYEDRVAFNEKVKGIIETLKNKKEQEVDVIYNIKGKKGEKGDMGPKPEKGKDYWTEADIKELTDSLRSSLTPKKGEDYFTPEELKSIASQILQEARPRKGKDYFDGQAGKDGLDGKPGAKGDRGPAGAKGEKGAKGDKGDSVTPDEVMKEIQKSKTFQIEKKNIKGFDMSDQRWHGSGSGGSGIPGGSNTEVQFNDSGSFGGDSAFAWDKANDILTLGNLNVTGSTVLDNGEISTDGSGGINVKNYAQSNPGGTAFAILSTASIASSDKTFTFPDASGIFALQSGVTQDVTVLTALPSTFATLHITNGIITSIT